MNSALFIRRLLPVLLLTQLVTPAFGQDDNFNDGNDTGWTRYAPLGPLGGTTYSVTGGKYVLACQPAPDPASVGPARCGSLRQDRVYTTFMVAVDFADFDPAEDTSVGILARVQPNPGAGATSGYSFTYQAHDHDVQISRIAGEVPTDISGSPDITFNTGGTYRMVFFGNGSYLEGRIYDMAAPETPLIRAFATDGVYEQGTCGLVIFSNDNTHTIASFDNYHATDGTLPPPNISIAGGTLTVSWDTVAGLAYDLYQSPDLMQWTMLAGFTYQNGRTIYSEPLDPGIPHKFFRQRFGPQP